MREEMLEEIRKAKGKGEEMKTYHVSYMAVYSETVEANSPEEAADIVERNCPTM